jgi:hypothetical protein
MSIQLTPNTKTEVDKQTAIELIKEYVGADCWAIKKDDVTIYDTYNERKEDEEKNKKLRKEILKNPFGKLLRGATEIIIYMFPDKTMTLTITYVSDNCWHAIEIESKRRGHKLKRPN